MATKPKPRAPKKPKEPKPNLRGSALRNHLTKTCPAPPAPKGNARAATHGAKSELTLAPAREHHMQRLIQDYPGLDNRRLALLADRLARIDLASAWIDQQQSVVRNKSGDVYPIVRDLEKWAARAEQMLREIEAEGRKTPRRDLALEMSAMDYE